MYRTLLPLALVLSGLLMGSCQEAPPPPPRSQITSTPHETETQGPGSWEAEFTKAELDAYEVAYGRWTDYQAASRPFFRDGVANAASLEIFEKYFYQPDVMQTQLESYEKSKIKAVGEHQVLWSRAGRIDLAATPPRGGGRGMHQCRADQHQHQRGQHPQQTPGSGSANHCALA